MTAPRRRSSGWCWGWSSSPTARRTCWGGAGGVGFSATMAMFTGMMHMPAPLAFLAIVAEFFGGLGLILGCLTRVAACGIGINMLVAMVTVHSAFGLFMHWTGAQQGEGFESHLLV